MSSKFIREQKHKCGPNYMEVDIFPITEQEHKASTRSKNKMATRLVQANLNAKNSKRHLLQLVNTNFTNKDIHITLTYKRGRVPKTEEEAEKNLDNYLRRINYRRKKRGLPTAKVIAVTEYQEENQNEKKRAVQFHHHVIINEGLSRDELEGLWSEGRGKMRRPIGMTNADRLQFDQDSLENLCNYLTKYPNRKKRWRQSIGLKQPIRPRPNDGRYTRSKVSRLAKECVDDADYWNKQYPGWELNGPAIHAAYHEQMGWYIYLQLRRIRNRKESYEKNERGDCK